MKITVIGGGSTYTPELIDGFARLGLPVEEIALVDPDTSRLAVIAPLAGRILARLGHPARVTATDDPDAGVDGADAVLLQLRVGGQGMRHIDETLPHDCGCIGQETTGVGGLAKALRTVPIVLDLAERIAKRAPAAWIVDFTNPVGIVTRALLDAGHRAVGLCNVAIGFQRTFADWLGVDHQRLSLEHVGLNHLTWERAVLLDGVDVMPQILAEHGSDLAARLHMPIEVVRRLGAIPSYYLRYYYAHDDALAEQLRGPSRAEQVAAMEAELLSAYADPALAEKPALLDRRGGAYYSEAAVQLVQALIADTGEVRVANVRNRGTLPFLPDDAVIEVPARIGAHGGVPLPVDRVEPLFAGLIAHVTAYEELALDAALRGGADRVATALLAHPLIGQADRAARLTDRLIAANRQYLWWA
ncbi:6-phospho-beta-glucosidase [Streptomyces sp. NPDC050625]|uniref:6-phospho-beta-glucosidase n=1 Tax=Streptomyces sp. NPDC050625 TaxID=3154629 RepID=UPI00343FFA7C